MTVESLGNAEELKDEISQLKRDFIKYSTDVEDLLNRFQDEFTEEFKKEILDVLGLELTRPLD